MRSQTVLSALVLSLSAIAACSASSESTPPRTGGEGGSVSSGATSSVAGTTSNGFSGSTGIAGTTSTGFGGAPSGAAGTSTGFGGAPPAAAGTTSTGTAGTGVTTGGGCTTTKVATGTDPLVDNFDMHPGSGLIPAADGRVGGWWISKSATGTVTPMAGAAPVPVDGGMTGMGLHIQGSDTDLTMGWGADASVAITPTGGCYDASIYTGGLKVSLKGNGSVYLSVITAEDKAASATSGNQRKEIPITSTWTDYTVPWSDLVTGWGTPIPLDLKEIVALDIAPSASSASNFDIWIDNLTFVK